MMNNLQIENREVMAIQTTNDKEEGSKRGYTQKFLERKTNEESSHTESEKEETAAPTLTMTDTMTNLQEESHDILVDITNKASSRGG